MGAARQFPMNGGAPHDGVDAKADRLLTICRGGASTSWWHTPRRRPAAVAVAAWDALGERSLAVTAASPSLAPEELEDARAYAGQFGFAHRIVETQEVDDPRYAANDGARCYFCKVNLYSVLQPLAVAEGYAWIANGTNLDDLGDYRPGIPARR